MGTFQPQNICIGYGVGDNDDSFSAGKEAALSAKAGLNQEIFSVVLVFASVRFQLEELLQGIHSVLGDVPLLGTTTAGEICNDPLNESVVVVILSSSYLNVRIGLGENVSEDWEQAVNHAVSCSEFCAYFNPQDTNYWSGLVRQGKSAFALLFSPGNTKYADSRSFEILEKLKKLSSGLLPIFGGGSADDWQMESNYVFMGNRVYPDSMVIAVFETQLCFGIGLTHGFNPTSQRAVATHCQDHEVFELDGKPAAQEYARLLGLPWEELKGKHLTLSTGIPIGITSSYEQYNITIASYFTSGNGVRFAQPIPEGTGVTIMEAEPDSMVVAGKEALRKAILRGNVKKPAVAFAFSCALRSHFLGERKAEEITSMKEMIGDVPLIGFYSFGEQGLSDVGVTRHNNDVITVLVLGQELSYAAQAANENQCLLRELDLRVTALKQAEDALKQSREEYKLLAENVNDIIWTSDLNFNWVYISPSCERLTGYTQEEALQMSLHEVLTPSSSKDTHHVLQNVLTRVGEDPLNSGDISVNTEIEFQHKDGSTVWAETNVNIQLDETGQPVRLYGVTRNISDRKEAEKERRKLEAQLRRAHKMEAIGTLAGGIAHDFNNILGIILGNAELAKDLVWGEALNSSLNEIKTACLRGRDVVKQIFPFSHQATDKMKPVRLSSIVEESIRLVRSSFPATIDIRYNSPAAFDTVCMEPTQIQRVFLNICANAAYAMRGENGILEINIDNVDIDASNFDVDLMQGNYVRLKIMDNGSGINRKIMNRIFDPYFTTKEIGEGSGMGLAVSHGIIKNHGGDITVESEKNKGTLFNVFLPATDQKIETVIEKDEKPGRGNERILFVDDEESLVFSTKYSLEKYGYTVSAVTSPIKALEVFEANPEAFDLVITDMTMPDMTGDVLAMEIIKIRPDIPIILCSGYPDSIDKQTAREIGIRSFRLKPVRFIEIASEVRRLLDAKDP